MSVQMKCCKICRTPARKFSLRIYLNVIMRKVYRYNYNENEGHIHENVRYEIENSTAQYTYQYLNIDMLK